MNIGSNTELQRLLPGFRVRKAVAIGQPLSKDLLVKIIARGERDHGNRSFFRDALASAHGAQTSTFKTKGAAIKLDATLHSKVIGEEDLLPTELKDIEEVVTKIEGDIQGVDAGIAQRLSREHQVELSGALSL